MDKTMKRQILNNKFEEIEANFGRHVRKVRYELISHLIIRWC